MEEKKLFSSANLAIDVNQITGADEPDELCGNSLIRIVCSDKEIVITGEEMDELTRKWSLARREAGMNYFVVLDADHGDVVRFTSDLEPEQAIARWAEVKGRQVNSLEWMVVPETPVLEDDGIVC